MFNNSDLILPEQVEIDRSTIPCEKLGVFSTMWIKEGTQMGPFSGRLIKATNENIKEQNNYTWEVRLIDSYDLKLTHIIKDKVHD